MRHAAVALAVVALTGCSLGGDDEAEGQQAGRAATTATTATTAVRTTTGDEETAPSAGGSSKSDYAKDADAICERFNDEIEAIAPPSAPEQLAPVLRAANTVARQELAELESLEPPPGREATVENFESSLRRVVAAVDRLAKAVETNDATAAQNALAEADLESDEARRLAEKLGLTECGRAGAAAAAS